jgi:uncharacterized iron-regulated membrane protein
MRETFRLSMAYMHTWLGLVLGFVLMAVFFFGTLSVFDREVDRWSVPETRAAAAAMPSFDQVVLPLVSQLRPDPESMEFAQDNEVIGQLPAADDLPLSDVSVYTSHRDPLIKVYGIFDVPNKPRDSSVDHVHVFGDLTVHPVTGERLTDIEQRLHLGTEFFYPMHFMLHLEWKDAGYWIVGLASLAMLAALVSGVVMHRKIFREFFTFRPEKTKLRSTLDLHNLTGVIALPFLFMLTFTGLFIMAYFYLPAVDDLMKPTVELQDAVEHAESGLPEDPVGRPGTLASVDAMAAEAKRRWTAKGTPGEIGFISVTHWGDAGAYVSIGRDSVDRVATSETLHFRAGTGELIYEDPPAAPIAATEGFLHGLHYQQFKHWGLRWLLFAGGLLSCACIATGFVFFVEKRRCKHAAAGAPGARIVDALAATAVTGMLIATAAMMLANRVLPVDLAAHDLWQERVFWFTWIAALAHAAVRSRAVAAGGSSPVWGEQCWVLAALSLSAGLANWATTGDHLLRTVASGYWPVAGVDLVLFAGSGAAAWAGYRLTVRGTLRRPRAVASIHGEPAHV